MPNEDETILEQDGNHYKLFQGYKYWECWFCGDFNAMSFDKKRDDVPYEWYCTRCMRHWNMVNGEPVEWEREYHVSNEEYINSETFAIKIPKQEGQGWFGEADTMVEIVDSENEPHT